ncbi:hypothetical protein [Accumulibacter sp.]|uniref:hypothetical protein n=1 Tax=Accumulibacter sp. TaxID=2053492 RepID=UPI002C59B82B|nr:hypothetical protein [Accumulibacter sp.]HRF06905.1 hypothetical protein [Accumulibacter sp.]
MNPFRARIVAQLCAAAAAVFAPAAPAADFDIVIAKGILEPQGLRRGGLANQGLIVSLAQGGLLIARETAGCRQFIVLSGMQRAELRSSAYATGCSPVQDYESIRSRVEGSETLAARVLLQLPAKGDNRPSPLAVLEDACLKLPQLSEETGRNDRRCPSGYLLAGVECRDSHCDNKRLRCCPYLDGNADGSERPDASYWISEETTGGRKSLYETMGFVNGLVCDSDYCDNLWPLAVFSSRVQNTGSCSWTNLFPEKLASSAVCSSGSFVAGILCADGYCGRLALRCCQAVPR